MACWEVVTNHLCLAAGLQGTTVARHFPKGFLTVLEEIKLFLNSSLMLDRSDLGKLSLSAPTVFCGLWVF